MSTLFTRLDMTVLIESIMEELCEHEKTDMIKNYSKKSIEIVDNQYFIDMDIRGHILGVLWLLLIGYRVDKNMYAHSYGNRIRKKMYNEFSEEPTYSPYLFEPYFQQYEGWRDTAMNEAMQHLHTGQDVVVLTLDFKRFYYSVDITKELFDGIYAEEIEAKEDDCDEFLMEAIDTVVDLGQASASFIQRRFKVGYARAGRIIDQMEERGVISGYQGSKPREVLMTLERLNELKMGSET